MIHLRRATAGLMMPGTDETSGSLFQLRRSGGRIPARHPLRKIRQVVNEALAGLDAEFETLYPRFQPSFDRTGTAVQASLIQILFSIRSEQPLMEQMQYK